MSHPSLGSAAPSNNLLLGALIKSANDAIISKDLNDIITSWNEAAERIFGATASEALGRPLTVFLPLSNAGETIEIFRQVQEGGVASHCETMGKTKEGSLIDLSLTVLPINNEEKKIIGVSLVARDISLEKREKERFKIILSAIADAVVSTDARGMITYFNAAAQRILGRTESQVLDRAFTEVFELAAQESQEDFTLNLGAPSDRSVARQTGQAMLALPERDAILIEYSATPIYTATAWVGYALVFRDVTDARAKEHAASRLAAIVESSDDAIVGKNLNGIVTSWNVGAQRLFGYTEKEIQGRSISLLLPEDRLNEEVQILARIQRGERIEHFETVRRRKDGSTVNVSLTISPIRGENGEIIGASKIARDITALLAYQEKIRAQTIELEAQVQKRTATLQHAVAELESFSYSLTHDMRAPLRAIQSFTEIVVDDYGHLLPQEAVSHLHRIVNSAARMDRLIQDVLAFSKISRSDIAIREIDLGRLLAEIVEERVEFGPSHAQIRAIPPLLPVRGHEASLTQAITNLLQNAVKFVAPGTRPIVEVMTERRNGSVRISIRDNGIGISASEKPRLFALFQRVPTSHLYQGTGVGLTIVRKSVERMNGTVGVDSTPGQGSTFWIELPELPHDTRP